MKENSNIDGISGGVDFTKKRVKGNSSVIVSNSFFPFHFVLKTFLFLAFISNYEKTYAKCVTFKKVSSFERREKFVEKLNQTFLSRSCKKISRFYFFRITFSRCIHAFS